MVEDRHVEETAFRSLSPGVLRVTASGSTRADPVCHAVGGKGILVPGDPALFGPATLETAGASPANSAIPYSALGNHAAMHAYLATDPLGILRRVSRKPVGGPVSVMDQLDPWPQFFELFPYAWSAKAYGAGYVPAPSPTKPTACHGALTDEALSGSHPQARPGWL